MRLILRGDKPSARKYIGFAKARLNDMKNIMNALGLDYMRKPPYRLPDADIVVESRYGLDSAWIVGKEIEHCKASFTFEITGLTVDFTSKLDIPDPAGAFWNFGDGQFSTALNPSHTYEEAGSYNVKLKGFELGGGSLPGGFAPFVIGAGELRNGNISASHAAAYSSFTASSWSSTGTKRNRYRVSYVVSPETWRYFGNRLNATIPLQDFAGTYPTGKAIIYITGTYLTYNRLGSDVAFPIVEEVSGSSGLGLNMRGSTILPQENIAGEINSDVPLVETIIRAIDSSDTDPYAILPDPKPTFSNEGWQTSILGSSEIGRLNVLPYKCISIKQKTITVT